MPDTIQPRILIVLVTIFTLLPAAALAKKEPPGKAVGQPAEASYETTTKWFRLRLVPRTPEQIAGFYEGRGFSPQAIDHLRSRCFFTALLSNTSDQVVWLELANWTFRSKDGVVARIERPVWSREWQEMGLPAAHQATFGWSLMPETRDLRPEEPVGGNITLPATAGPITVNAVFYLGADKSEGKAEVTIEGELCRR